MFCTFFCSSLPPPPPECKVPDGTLVNMHLQPTPAQRSASSNTTAAKPSSEEGRQVLLLAFHPTHPTRPTTAHSAFPAFLHRRFSPSHAAAAPSLVMCGSRCRFCPPSAGAASCRDYERQEQATPADLLAASSPRRCGAEAGPASKGAGKCAQAARACLSRGHDGRGWTLRLGNRIENRENRPRRSRASPWPARSRRPDPRPPARARPSAGARPVSGSRAVGVLAQLGRPPSPALAARIAMAPAACAWPRPRAVAGPNLLAPPHGVRCCRPQPPPFPGNSDGSSVADDSDHGGRAISSSLPQRSWAAARFGAVRATAATRTIRRGGAAAGGVATGLHSPLMDSGTAVGGGAITEQSTLRRALKYRKATQRVFRNTIPCAVRSAGRRSACAWRPPSPRAPPPLLARGLMIRSFACV